VQVVLHGGNYAALGLDNRSDIRVKSRVERVGREKLGQKADAQHLLGVDLHPGEEQLLCRGNAEVVHVTPQSAGVVVDGEARRGHEHARAGDTQPDVATQRQVGAAAVHAALDGRDGRHGQRLERVQHPLEAVIQL
jgi:hypothetical protein